MKFPFLKLFLFLFFLCSLTGSFGQSISTIDIEKGLSNNTVTAIFQDKYGWMWFGTFDGLNRYDGYSTLRFRQDTGKASLPDNYISAIDEDHDGHLWIGTKKGPVIFDAVSQTFRKIHLGTSSDKENVFFKDQVNALCSGAQGEMWIGSEKTGLLLFRKKDSAARVIPLKVSKYHSATSYTVSALQVMNGHSVWMLVKNIGLCIYEPEKSEAFVIDPSIKDGNCLSKLINGNFWIGTNSGLYMYSLKYKLLEKINGDGQVLAKLRIMDVTPEGDKLWLSTDGEGIIVVNSKSHEVVRKLNHDDHQFISSNAVYTVFIDARQRKWIGTMRGGVNCIDSQKNIFKTYSHKPFNTHSLGHNVVMSFCEEGNNIWIGTDGKGVSIWNRKSDVFQHHRFTENRRFSSGEDQITAMVKDNERYIFIASYGAGVKRFDKLNGTFENIPFEGSGTHSKYVWRLFKDSKGNLWAGCLRGRWAGKLPVTLFKYNRETERFETSFYQVSGEVFSMEGDVQGNLWIGTLSDLIQIAPEQKIIRHFKMNTTLRDIFADGDSTLWLATADRGLLKFNKFSRTYQTYNESRGLANNTVVSIEKDTKGFLWAGTFNGLSRIDTRTGRIYNFTSDDGLQSNQFYYNASLQLSDGKLLFGGIKGFNIFDPQNIIISHDFPSVLVSGVKVLGKAVHTNHEGIESSDPYHIRKITLPYDESMFSLEVTALAYSSPQKIKYRYFLDGWDKQWNYTDNRVISYSRLNEGKYLLKINTTNSAGTWNKQSEEIKIVVLPPWYRSWWAYILYTLAGATAVYLYSAYQKKQARLLYQVKLTKIQSEQQKELNEKRISFFTNVSHELRAPLTMIANPIKDLLESGGKNFDLLNISSVYRNTRRLLSLVDQLLLFRSIENEITDLKEEALDIIEVAHEVYLCFHHQAKAKGLAYIFKSETDKLEMLADREKIEIVLFNLISNAIKYTPEKGKVTVTIQQRENEVVLVIKDSGIGIPYATGDRLFERFYRLKHEGKVQSGFGVGLFVSKKIAEKQGGDLRYESEMQKGSVFYYILPLKNTGNLPLHQQAATPTVLLRELMDTDNVVDDNMPLPSQTDAVYEQVISGKAIVLIIDDDKNLREYMKQALKQDYTVFECENAEQGLKILEEIEPDIILCDVLMPGISGVDFCDKVKHSSKSFIPVILLTGTSSAEIRLRGIECGAEDYMTKPFELSLLKARIKSILKGRESIKRYFFNEITLQINNELISEDYSDFLKKGIEIINSHLEDENFNVNAFVSEMEMSHSNVFRKVKQISGLSISEFIRYVRLKKAAEMMIQSNIQVKQVGYKVGLNDPKYFRKHFVKLFGITPSEYIKKYRKNFN